MKLLRSTQKYFNDFLHLFYPHNCIGCGTDVLQSDQIICISCYSALPFTRFEHYQRNPVEKIFYGRANVFEAASALYFTKHSTVQRLIFELKYRSNRKAGLFLGNLMGHSLKNCNRFNDIDLLIPMPLNENRLRQRGYNQASVLIEGIQLRMNIPSNDKAVIRSENTETQTHKNRLSRWQSMQTAFSVADPELLRNKHILIIDDVVTTGASLESLINSIHEQVSCKVSILTAAWTSL